MPRLRGVAPCGRVAAAVALLGLFRSTALGQAPDVENDFGLRFGAGYSDNLTRSATNTVTDTYRLVGFDFSSARDGRRLVTDLRGDVEVREYQSSTLDREPVGTIDAFVGVNIVPERFVWRFNDSYGQGRVNQFQVVGPGNRQDINVFSTGPEVTLPLGSRTFMRLTAEHERRRFKSTGQLDSDSDLVELGVFRVLNPTTNVGLTASTREITSDAQISAWEDDTVFLSYDKTLASGAAQVRVGQNEVSVGGASTSGPLFDASWARDVGARSRMTVAVSQDFVDPGDRFLYSNTLTTAPGSAPVVPSDVILGAGVYEFSSVSVGNTTTLARSTLSINASAGQARYETTTSADNDETRLNFSWNRDITELLALGVNLSRYDSTFVQLDQENEDHYAQVWLSKTFGRRVALQFIYRRESRDGQGTGSYSYTENAYQVNVRLDLNP